MQTNNLKYTRYYRYLLGKWSQIVGKVVTILHNLINK